MAEETATAAVKRMLAGKGPAAAAHTAFLTTPLPSSRGSILAKRLSVHPSGATPVFTPISKTIHMLQQQNSATPTGNAQVDAGSSDLSVCKADLAKVLKEVRVTSYNCTAS